VRSLNSLPRGARGVVRAQICFRLLKALTMTSWRSPGTPTTLLGHKPPGGAAESQAGRRSRCQGAGNSSEFLAVALALHMPRKSREARRGPGKGV